MKLEIKGNGNLADSFSSIWGFYVNGFNHKEHCQACFKGNLEAKVQRHMSMDDVELRNDMPYFYFCALGRPRTGTSNVHLVVAPQPGAVASVGSIYGFTFTVQDSAAIRIRTLPKGWRGLGDEFTQCPNFQFGVQKYGYPSTEGSRDFGEHLLVQKTAITGKE